MDAPKARMLMALFSQLAVQPVNAKMGFSL